MALDKVVDSTALDAQLTSIADAIRSKGGTTDQLTLAGMVDAINAIQTGGGGIQSASGEYSIAEDVASLNIDISDIGFVPDLVAVYLDETDMEYTSTPTKIWYLSYVPDIIDMVNVSSNLAYSRTNVGVLWRGGRGTYTQQTAAPSSNFVGTVESETGIRIHLMRSAASYPIIAGTYKWFAYKIWSDN